MTGGSRGDARAGPEAPRPGSARPRRQRPAAAGMAPRCPDYIPAYIILTMRRVPAEP